MFCTYCGNKLDDDALFCAKCGRRVDGQTAAASHNQNFSAQQPRAENPQAQKNVQTEFAQSTATSASVQFNGPLSNAQSNSKTIDIILALVFGVAVWVSGYALDTVGFIIYYRSNNYLSFDYLYIPLSIFHYAALVFFGAALGRIIKPKNTDVCAPLAIVSAVLFFASLFIFLFLAVDYELDSVRRILLVICAVASAGVFGEAFAKPKKKFCVVFGILSAICMLLPPLVYLISDYAYSDFPPALDIFFYLFISFASIFIIGVSHKTQLHKSLSVLLLCFVVIFSGIYRNAFTKLLTENEYLKNGRLFYYDVYFGHRSEAGSIGNNLLGYMSMGVNKSDLKNATVKDATAR